MTDNLRKRFSASPEGRCKIEGLSGPPIEPQCMGAFGSQPDTPMGCLGGSARFTPHPPMFIMATVNIPKPSKNNRIMPVGFECFANPKASEAKQNLDSFPRIGIYSTKSEINKSYDDNDDYSITPLSNYDTDISTPDYEDLSFKKEPTAVKKLDSSSSFVTKTEGCHVGGLYGSPTRISEGNITTNNIKSKNILVIIRTNIINLSKQIFRVIRNKLISHNSEKYLDILNIRSPSWELYIKKNKPNSKEFRSSELKKVSSSKFYNVE